MSEEEVRHDRVLEPFEEFRDKELVYGALAACRLFARRMDPKNLVIGLIDRALEHRLHELRDTYDARNIYRG